MGDGKGESSPALSPLTGAYLLVILPQTHAKEHLEPVIHKLTKGLLSWDSDCCHVDLYKELQTITTHSPEGELVKHGKRLGERLIQFASENLVTEVLIHPQLNTLVQCLRNLLSSFTRHRHIIHAGYTYSGNGSWILQDGTFSFADFHHMFQEIEVQRVLVAYENTVTMDIHCCQEGDWANVKTTKEPFAKLSRLSINPDDKISVNDDVKNFAEYLRPYIVSYSLEQLLEPSDVVGNIRFSHPTLYVFPGGQGDAALFGINGFNMLVDGGFSRKTCFWDFTRHLDRLDAALVTRLNNGNIQGISSFLQRKKMNHVYPQIGHFFCNIQDRRQPLSPDGDKDRDPMLVNIIDQGQELVSSLHHLNLKPQPCYRDSTMNPINLYHKVGHGKLDMYVLSPAKDSREVKDFISRWNANDIKLFATVNKKTGEFSFPLPNRVSICALLVWQPANPNDNITRLFFPGSTPQHKIMDGLEKIKHLDFLKHPVCTAKSLSPSSSTIGLNIRQNLKTKTYADKPAQPITNDVKPPKLSELSKVAKSDTTDAKIRPHARTKKLTEKTKEGKTKEEKLIENKSKDEKEDKSKENQKEEAIEIESVKEKDIISEKGIDTCGEKLNEVEYLPRQVNINIIEEQTQIENTIIDQKDDEKIIAKNLENLIEDIKEKKLDNEVKSEIISVDKPKKEIEAKKIKSEVKKKGDKIIKKKEPSERVKVEKVDKEEKPKRAIKKTERKIPKVPSKTDEKKPESAKSSPTTPKKTPVPKSMGEPKTRPIKSRASPSATPAKSTKEENNRKVVEQRAQKIQARKEEVKKSERKPLSRRAPAESPREVKKEKSPVKALSKAKPKKSIDKDAKATATTTSQQSAVPPKDKVIKGKKIAESEIKIISDIVKDSDILNGDASLSKEEDEILIVEKIELELYPEEAPSEEKETATSLKKDYIEGLAAELKEGEAEEIKQEVSGIIKTAADIVMKAKSPEEAEKAIKDKMLIKEADKESKEKSNEMEQKQQAEESHPDEKFSATVESGATTTAPTLPEDERIPIEDVKEAEEGVEEKHVIEETKEKDLQQRPEQLDSKPEPTITTFDQKAQILRDIVKTPDEVADLPVHEVADYETAEQDIAQGENVRPEEISGDELKFIKDGLEKEDKSKDLKEDLIPLPEDIVQKEDTQIEPTAVASAALFTSQEGKEEIETESVQKTIYQSGTKADENIEKAKEGVEDIHEETIVEEAKEVDIETDSKTVIETVKTPDLKIKEMEEQIEEKLAVEVANNEELQLPIQEIKSDQQVNDVQKDLVSEETIKVPEESDQTTESKKSDVEQSTDVIVSKQDQLSEEVKKLDDSQVEMGVEVLETPADSLKERAVEGVDTTVAEGLDASIIIPERNEATSDEIDIKAEKDVLEAEAESVLEKNEEIIDTEIDKSDVPQKEEHMEETTADSKEELEKIKEEKQEEEDQLIKPTNEISKDIESPLVKESDVLKVDASKELESFVHETFDDSKISHTDIEERDKITDFIAPSEEAQEVIPEGEAGKEFLEMKEPLEITAPKIIHVEDKKEKVLEVKDQKSKDVAADIKDQEVKEGDIDVKDQEQKESLKQMQDKDQIETSVKVKDEDHKEIMEEIKDEDHKEIIEKTKDKDKKEIIEGIKDKDQKEILEEIKDKDQKEIIEEIKDKDQKEIIVEDIEQKEIIEVKDENVKETSEKDKEDIKEETIVTVKDEEQKEIKEEIKYEDKKGTSEEDQHEIKKEIVLAVKDDNQKESDEKIKDEGKEETIIEVKEDSKETVVEVKDEDIKETIVEVKEEDKKDIVVEAKDEDTKETAMKISDKDNKEVDIEVKKETVIEIKDGEQKDVIEEIRDEDKKETSVEIKDEEQKEVIEETKHEDKTETLVEVKEGEHKEVIEELKGEDKKETFIEIKDEGQKEIIEEIKDVNEKETVLEVKGGEQNEIIEEIKDEDRKETVVEVKDEEAGKQIEKIKDEDKETAVEVKDEKSKELLEKTKDEDKIPTVVEIKDKKPIEISEDIKGLDKDKDAVVEEQEQKEHVADSKDQDKKEATLEVKDQDQKEKIEEIKGHDIKDTFVEVQASEEINDQEDKDQKEIQEISSEVELSETSVIEIVQGKEPQVSKEVIPEFSEIQKTKDVDHDDKDFKKAVEINQTETITNEENKIVEDVDEKVITEGITNELVQNEVPDSLDHDKKETTLIPKEQDQESVLEGKLEAPKEIDTIKDIEKSSNILGKEKDNQNKEEGKHISDHYEKPIAVEEEIICVKDNEMTAETSIIEVKTNNEAEAIIKEIKQIDEIQIIPSDKDIPEAKDKAVKDDDILQDEYKPVDDQIKDIKKDVDEEDEKIKIVEKATDEKSEKDIKIQESIAIEKNEIKNEQELESKIHEETSKLEEIKDEEDSLKKEEASIKVETSDIKDDKKMLEKESDLKTEITPMDESSQAESKDNEVSKEKKDSELEANIPLTEDMQYTDVKDIVKELSSHIEDAGKLIQKEDDLTIKCKVEKLAETISSDTKEIIKEIDKEENIYIKEEVVKPVDATHGTDLAYESKPDTMAIKDQIQDKVETDTIDLKTAKLSSESISKQDTSNIALSNEDKELDDYVRTFEDASSHSLISSSPKVYKDHVKEATVLDDDTDEKEILQSDSYNKDNIEKENLPEVESKVGAEEGIPDAKLVDISSLHDLKPDIDEHTDKSDESKDLKKYHIEDLPISEVTSAKLSISESGVKIETSVEAEASVCPEKIQEALSEKSVLSETDPPESSGKDYSSTFGVKEEIISKESEDIKTNIAKPDSESSITEKVLDDFSVISQKQKEISESEAVSVDKPGEVEIIADNSLDQKIEKEIHVAEKLIKCSKVHQEESAVEDVIKKEISTHVTAKIPHSQMSEEEILKEIEQEIIPLARSKRSVKSEESHRKIEAQPHSHQAKIPVDEKFKAVRLPYEKSEVEEEEEEREIEQQTSLVPDEKNLSVSEDGLKGKDEKGSAVDTAISDIITTCEKVASVILKKDDDVKQTDIEIKNDVVQSIENESLSKSVIEKSESAPQSKENVEPSIILEKKEVIEDKIIATTTQIENTALDDILVKELDDILIKEELDVLASTTDIHSEGKSDLIIKEEKDKVTDETSKKYEKDLSDPTDSVTIKTSDVSLEPREISKELSQENIVINEDQKSQMEDIEKGHEKKLIEESIIKVTEETILPSEIDFSELPPQQFKGEEIIDASDFKAISVQQTSEAIPQDILTDKKDQKDECKLEESENIEGGGDDISVPSSISVPFSEKDKKTDKDSVSQNLSSELMEKESSDKERTIVPFQSETEASLATKDAEDTSSEDSKSEIKKIEDTTGVSKSTNEVITDTKVQNILGHISTDLKAINEQLTNEYEAKQKDESSGLMKDALASTEVEISVDEKKISVIDTSESQAKEKKNEKLDEFVEEKAALSEEKVDYFTADELSHKLEQTVVEKASIALSETKIRDTIPHEEDVDSNKTPSSSPKELIDQPESHLQEQVTEQKREDKETDLKVDIASSAAEDNISKSNITDASPIDINSKIVSTEETREVESSSISQLIESSELQSALFKDIKSLTSCVPEQETVLKEITEEIKSIGRKEIKEDSDEFLEISEKFAEIQEEIKETISKTMGKTEEIEKSTKIHSDIKSVKTESLSESDQICSQIGTDEIKTSKIECSDILHEKEILETGHSETSIEMNKVEPEEKESSSMVEKQDKIVHESISVKDESLSKILDDNKCADALLLADKSESIKETMTSSEEKVIEKKIEHESSLVEASDVSRKEESKENDLEAKSETKKDDIDDQTEEHKGSSEKPTKHTESSQKEKLKKIEETVISDVTPVTKESEQFVVKLDFGIDAPETPKVEDTPDSKKIGITDEMKHIVSDSRLQKELYTSSSTTDYNKDTEDRLKRIEQSAHDTVIKHTDIVECSSKEIDSASIISDKNVSLKEADSKIPPPTPNITDPNKAISSHDDSGNAPQKHEIEVLEKTIKESSKVDSKEETFSEKDHIEETSVKLVTSSFLEMECNRSSEQSVKPERESPASTNVSDKRDDKSDVIMSSITSQARKDEPIRSIILGSDIASEMESSTPRDIIGSQESRTATHWESSEGKQDLEHFESDEEIHGSPMSTASHIPSPPNFDYDPKAKDSAMTSSFYGSLPEDPNKKDTFAAMYISKYDDDSEVDAKTFSPKKVGPFEAKVSSERRESMNLNGSKDADKTISEPQAESSKDPIESWGKPLGLPPPPKSMANFDDWNPIVEWGHPLGLPSPAPPPKENGDVDLDLSSQSPTRRKIEKLNAENERIASNIYSGKDTINKMLKRSESPVKKVIKSDAKKGSVITPIYLDLTYVPHHGNSHYADVEFFKKIRARYYVFSGTEPSKEVFNALLEAKQTWEDKDLEVTIIPTYDTDTLAYWVAENEETLSKYKIDLSPSASRCTINLQDHETSCSAYRLEF